MSDLDPKDPNSSEMLTKICLMLIFGLFASNNIVALTHEFRISVFLLAIFNLLIVFLYMIRRLSISVTTSNFDKIVAIAGTLSPFFYVASPTPHEIAFLQILGILGLLLSIAGLGFLNRSFGIIPANRGVVTSGIYKFVRHPIYAGYIILQLSFLIQNFSIHNLIVYACFVALEVTRVVREEALLTQSPEYLEYTKKTRWRILPYIW